MVYIVFTTIKNKKQENKKMKKIMYDVIVTTNPAIAEMLVKVNIIDKNIRVISAVNSLDQIHGLNVINAMEFFPCSLSQYCKAYSEIHLDIPTWLKIDNSLSEGQIMGLIRGIETFKVLANEEWIKREKVIQVLKFYALEAKHEWDELKAFLLDGNDPRQHSLYEVCALDGFRSFSEHVIRYAKTDFWPLVDSGIEAEIFKALEGQRISKPLSFDNVDTIIEALEATKQYFENRQNGNVVPESPFDTPEFCLFLTDQALSVLGVDSDDNNTKDKN